MSPLPNPSLSFAEQDLVILVAMALWGEARGCSEEAKLGVGCVIQNRVANGHFGRGFAGVLLKPHQFDCFSPNDPNHDKLLHPLDHDTPAVWDECYQIAAEIVYGKQEDVTNGSLFYFSPPLTEPPTCWGNVELTGTMDTLHFYRMANE